MPLAQTEVSLGVTILCSPDLAELLAQYAVGSNPLLVDVRPLSRLSAVNRALRAVAWRPLLLCRGEFTLATRLRRTRPRADEPAERLEQWCEQWQARVDGLCSSLQAWLAETPEHTDGDPLCRELDERTFRACVYAAAALAEHAPRSNVVLRPDVNVIDFDDESEFLDSADGALARRLAETCDALDSVTRRAGPELRAVATLALSALYTFFLDVGNAKTFNLALSGLTRSLESKFRWQELGDVRGTTLFAAVRLAAVVRGARHSNESEWQFDDELPYGFEEMRRVVDIATAAHSTLVDPFLDEFSQELCVYACSAGMAAIQHLAPWRTGPGHTELPAVEHALVSAAVFALHLAVDSGVRVLAEEMAEEAQADAETDEEAEAD